MTSAQFGEVIESVLGTVPFDGTLSVAYCASVRDELRKQLPGYQLEVFYRRTELNVWVSLGGAVVCTRVFEL